jgi:predicted ATPase
MIHIPISVNLPELWGTKTFIKNEWNEINLIVGPNGTGKSMFAEQLKKQLQAQSYKPRLLTAERLSGLEKQNYTYFASSNFDRGLDISNFSTLKSSGENYGLSSSAFIVLKERLDVRVKIEALLSDIFKKTIRLVEEGGYLKPRIQNNTGGMEYGLKEKECHGLKELITLLTFLYDGSHDCIIFDEPELHLHPQFQSFFLSEIRKFAGDPKTVPGEKCFSSLLIPPISWT